MVNTNGSEEEKRGCAGDGGTAEQEAISSSAQGDCGESGERQVERREKNGRIYFIETHDGTFVKIGFAVDVPRRLDQLGTMMPGLRLLGYIPGTRTGEAELHRKFASHHERGEWFRQAEEITAFVDSMVIPMTLMTTPSVKRSKLRNGMPHSEMARMGGKARWKGTTKEQRSEAGRKAIAARWEKERAKAAKKAKKAK